MPEVGEERKAGRMNESIKKRTPQERLVIANTLIESVLQDISPEQPEIIRCKDCRHLGTKKIFEGYYICPFTEKNVTHDDFCSYAERRTDDGK